MIIQFSLYCVTKKKLLNSSLVFNQVSEKMSEALCVPNKNRKHRTIYNGYINIDNIETSPGNNYIKWIKITKDKLKQREIQLLSIKIAEIQRIVNESICGSINIQNSVNKTAYQSHYNRNYQISNSLIQSIFHEFLFPAIDRWNGVHIDRIKKTITKFRDYFVIGKNWWDLSKKRLIGSVFWVKIFEDIDQVKQQ